LNQAQDSVSTAEAQLAEVLETEATIEADAAQASAELAAAESRFELLLDVASTLLRDPLEGLLRQEAGMPRWRSVARITVRAEAAGAVENIGVTNGAWASPETDVLGTVRPQGLRFRASGLQSDLGVLRDGLAARIVPPTPTATGSAVPLDQTMSGTLRLGLTADADDRTIELFVTPQELLPWARSGVSAQLEIVTDATALAVPAIPLAAVQRDGLAPVVFRRAPDNPNEAIRMEADLGADDGRWIAVLSGVREGDEVVLDGAFQLMLATSGSIQKGGHFHSDGTFHDGEH
jgi:multidrug efflux pump subunit AcrA (membrane-fusion protein)